MTTIAEVADVLQVILTTTAEDLAWDTGFTQRTSKLSGGRFVQTLVFGWLANPDASLAELAQTAAATGVPVSPQALDQRCTEAAARYLERVLAAAVGALVVAEPVAVPLFERFSGVYVLDSTTIRLPDAFAERFPGCGGSSPSAGLASLKLQVRLELRQGALAGLHPDAGRSQDRASAMQTAPLPAGALRLTDLGYFSLEVLRQYDLDGVYWLSRYQVQTAVFDEQDRRVDDLPGWLAAQGDRVDRSVALGADQHLPCRLLAARIPPAVAAERRRKLRAEAQREGKTPSRRKLALCDWTIYVTNVPPERLTLAEALVLGRVRWQIELLFKLWKSHGRVDESRSAKPWRILCEIYAKLLAMVVQHWCYLVGCWRCPDRSLVKAAQTIRKFALSLAGSLHSSAGLVAVLGTIARCLSAAGRIQRRRGKPPTWQLLVDVPTDDGLEEFEQLDAPSFAMTVHDLAA